MALPPPPPVPASEPKTRMEIWESAVAGTVYVKVWDARQRDYRDVRVGGQTGQQRVTISEEDRLYNQSLVREDLRHLDPFTNGSLVRLDQQGQRETEGLDDRVRKALEVLDPDDFLAALNEMSEREVRMLQQVIEDTGEGRVWQHAVVRDLIADKFLVAKTQRTIREMEEGRTDGGTRLYG